MLTLTSTHRPPQDAPAIAAAPQVWHWLGMRWRMPGDWAVVRHAVDPQRGKLAIVDRDAQRLLLAWSPMPAEPDWARYFSDAQALELEEKPAALFLDLPPELTPWRGFTRLDGQRQLLRAARFDALRQRLIEAVIPCAGDEQAADAFALLASFVVSGADAGKSERLRAFDLDVTPPAGWALDRVLVTPGRVEGRFARGRSQAVVRRLGLAQSWYNGDAAALAKYSAKDDRGRVEPLPHEDGPGVLVAGHEKTKRIVTLMGRRRRQLDAVWHDRAANAVVHVTLLLTRGDDTSPLDFDAHALDPYADAGGEA